MEMSTNSDQLYIKVLFGDNQCSDCKCGCPILLVRVGSESEIFEWSAVVLLFYRS